MLTSLCINPPIMAALARCGHGSKILIADGNYPLEQMTECEDLVYLGLTAGTPTVTEVLKVLHGVCNFEKAELMTPGDGTEPEIFAEFREELPDAEFAQLGRYEFYDACKGEDVLLAVSTGEKRVFANILLTVGCA